MALREITFQEAVFQCELLFVEYFLWKFIIYDTKAKVYTKFIDNYYAW